MSAILWVHILAGSLSLLAGALALCVTKGGALHRQAGNVFVATMVVMGATGALIAALHNIRISVIAGLLAVYLVLTSLLTLRRIADAGRGIDIGLAILGGAIVVMSGIWGAMALQSPKGTLDGYPAAAFIVFGSIALIGTVLDTRLLLARSTDHAAALRGKHRIARHLWRMGFAMLLATSSFFLGQAKHFPEIIRQSGLLPVPVLLVLLATLYWLARTLLAKRSDARLRTSAPSSAD